LNLIGSLQLQVSTLQHIFLHSCQLFNEICCTKLDIENQTISLPDILAVCAGNQEDARGFRRNASEIFHIYAVRRIGKQKWSQYRITFQHSEANLIAKWVEKINSILAQPGIQRSET